jgi:hypothetical protein
MIPYLLIEHVRCLRLKGRLQSLEIWSCFEDLFKEAACIYTYICIYTYDI